MLNSTDRLVLFIHGFFINLLNGEIFLDTEGINIDNILEFNKLYVITSSNTIHPLQAILPELVSEVFNVLEGILYFVVKVISLDCFHIYDARSCHSNHNIQFVATLKEHYQGLYFGEFGGYAEVPNINFPVRDAKHLIPVNNARIPGILDMLQLHYRYLRPSIELNLFPEHGYNLLKMPPLVYLKEMNITGHYCNNCNIGYIHKSCPSCSSRKTEQVTREIYIYSYQNIIYCLPTQIQDDLVFSQYLHFWYIDGVEFYYIDYQRDDSLFNPISFVK